MQWTVTFHTDNVKSEILAMPDGFLSRFVRYAERMEIYGPDLGMPQTRAMSEGQFELRLKAAEGIARVSIAPSSIATSSFSIRSQRRPTKHRHANLKSPVSA